MNTQKRAGGNNLENKERSDAATTRPCAGSLNPASRRNPTSEASKTPKDDGSRSIALHRLPNSVKDVSYVVRLNQGKRKSKRFRGRHRVCHCGRGLQGISPLGNSFTSPGYADMEFVVSP
jgi:hypothetical protein